MDGDVSTSHRIFFDNFHGVKYIEWSQTHQIDAICIRNACEDGLDNDGDGFIDLDDSKCKTSGHLNERYLLAPPQAPRPVLPSLGPIAATLLALSLTALSVLMQKRNGRSTVVRSDARFRGL